eukprot:TRINITY_DN4394_c0_g2_i1.p1 TRINITY_DN4394_c0_g2~~TRINITY_DN4394_c0_g2_i1.p1  ORF type:complete len:330 (-),score=78.76 TRINITY_DN4394_c0_g2_i1:314-1303(-)
MASNRRKSLIVVLLVLVVVSTTSIQQFEQFKVDHGKVYDTHLEHLNRFAIFQDNLERIELLNQQSNGAVYGINKFADLTPEEFREIYLTGYDQPLPTNEPTNESTLIPKHQISQLPLSFDWRNKDVVTNVKDQGQCGSCWAFSIVENIESVWILAGKGTISNTILSTQQVVDCDQQDDGCSGGDPPTAFDYVISAGGLEYESDYPYKADDGYCKFNSADVDARVSSWKYATSNDNEDLLQQNLYSWAPLSICVDASSWQYYNGGVMMGSDCGDELDHCVQLVGWNQQGSTPFWIVRNSWSTSWGIDGYIHLQMGQNTCGVADEATTAVV